MQQAYGALSVPAGTLDISAVEEENELTISWTERGDPSVKAPSGGDGFGSSMVKRSISGQLGGEISYDWSESGVIVTFVVKKSRLAN